MSRSKYSSICERKYELIEDKKDLNERPAPVGQGCESSRWKAALLGKQVLANVAGGCSGGFSDRSNAPESTGYQ